MAAAEVSTSAIHAYWKDFDLDNRRSKLDEVGLLSDTCDTHASWSTHSMERNHGN